MRRWRDNCDELNLRKLFGKEWKLVQEDFKLETSDGVIIRSQSVRKNSGFDAFVIEIRDFK